MIGIDGSVESERAVREVGSRVWPAGTDVRIISVDEGLSHQSLSPIVPITPELIDEEKALAARNMVHWAQRELSAIGLHTSSYIEKGDPKKVLIEKALEWNVDSIFVGARRFTSTFERFWLGSVSTALVTKAHSSVEVVRTVSN
jgi:nucleotide-binding universal stress UspA family protein